MAFTKKELQTLFEMIEWFKRGESCQSFDDLHAKVQGLLKKPVKCAHSWRYSMTSSQCIVCNEYCNCEMQYSASIRAKECKHCYRQELAIPF